jgi:hypothetical protein
LFFCCSFYYYGPGSKLGLMANKTASLYLNIRKPDGKWTFARPAVANNGRLKPLVALIDKHEEKHPEAK